MMYILYVNDLQYETASSLVPWLILCFPVHAYGSTGFPGSCGSLGSTGSCGVSI